jgi:predicted enzyme related to lactoylglutathione lyase
MAADTTSQAGRFVWYELMTTDIEKVVPFYKELLSWETTAAEIEGFGTYTMIQAAGKEIGGIVPLEPEASIPSHWLAYVSVPNVDAAVEKAKELGGEPLVPATDIPNIGRFAVLKDQLGAVISPYKSASEQSPTEEEPAPVGHFCWNELLTEDQLGAQKFYCGVFGWTVGEMPMADGSTYYIFKCGDRDTAGMMRKPPEVPIPAAWLTYIRVDNVAATVAKAKELGATICAEPLAVPEVGTFAVLMDPAQGTFAVFQGADVA